MGSELPLQTGLEPHEQFLCQNPHYLANRYALAGWHSQHCLRGPNLFLLGKGFEHHIDHRYIEVAQIQIHLQNKKIS
jgi:hypothetical protein